MYIVILLLKSIKQDFDQINPKNERALLKTLGTGLRISRISLEAAKLDKSNQIGLNEFDSVNRRLQNSTTHTHIVHRVGITHRLLQSFDGGF